MAWLLIALALIAACGPLLWLLPSRRERRLAQWRSAARRAGLVVELVRVEQPDAPPEDRVTAAGLPRPAQRQCAAYRLPLLPSLVAAPGWRLLKSSREPQALPGWMAPRPPVGAPAPAAEYWQRLRPLLDALPGGCVGVEASARAVSWLGLETAGDGEEAPAAIARIAAGLEAIAALHRELAPPAA